MVFLQPHYLCQPYIYLSTAFLIYMFQYGTVFRGTFLKLRNGRIPSLKVGLIKSVYENIVNENGVANGCLSI